MGTILGEYINVIFMTDNKTVQSALNSGKSNNSIIMHWIKELFWLAVDYNFSISSAHVLGLANSLCGALSRWSEPSATSCLVAAGTSCLCCFNVFA